MCDSEVSGLALFAMIPRHNIASVSCEREVGGAAPASAEYIYLYTFWNDVFCAGWRYRGHRKEAGRPPGRRGILAVSAPSPRQVPVAEILWFLVGGQLEEVSGSP